nr:S-methyl-5-thioribose-1-phosphate isomerase [Actinomycetota bacterium]
MPTTTATVPITSVRWDGHAPVIIDQRHLPDRLVEWRLASVDDVVEAIRTLAVRGAPAIGIAGGYGVVVGLD